MNRRLIIFVLLGLFVAAIALDRDDQAAAQYPGRGPSAGWAAANPDDQAAVEIGREALRAQPYPWYEEETDTRRSIEVEVPVEISQHRRSSWDRARAEIPESESTWDWPKAMSIVMRVLGWTAVAVVAGFLIWLLVRAWLRAESRATSVAEIKVSDEAGVSDRDRVESLPFQLDAPTTDLLAEARRHYEAGRFGDAIIYFFSYQLVQLDRNQLIRLSKGKTNRQYLRELPRVASLRAQVERTMVAFEDVFFGGHALEQQRFESCWRQLGEFESLVQQSARELV